jgi:hypothetical protein
MVRALRLLELEWWLVEVKVLVVAVWGHAWSAPGGARSQDLCVL